MSIRAVTTLLILGTLHAQRSLAVEEPSAASMESRTTAALPGVELQSLLQRVTESAKKRFLVEAHVPSQVVIGTVDPKSVTFPMLLVPILRPLIARGGHFAALADQNALILVDSYANGRRILELIAALDKPAPKGP